MKRLRNYIPAALIWFRLAVSLTIPIAAFLMQKQSNILIMWLLIVGFASDLFDGIIARLLKVSTIFLRRFDSIVDRVFWLISLGSLIMLWPDFFKAKLTGILIILILEAMKYLISFLRFHKEMSAHALLSKAFGVCILIAFCEFLGRSGASSFFDIMLIIGCISRVDSILIVLILPRWDHDIPSCYHAWQIRQGRAIKYSKFLNG